jgi:predicted Zn-dependent protease
MRSIFARTLVALVGLLGSAPHANAHDGLHEQIVALTHEIESRPKAPELYLRRGELYRLHREWDKALADLRRAQALEPRREMGLAEARLYFDLGWSEWAELALERHLASLPEDPEALLFLARILEQRCALEDAVRAYDRALVGLEAPEPDVYLARAEALTALGPAGVERALVGLDEALARLGPVFALELRALELEVERGRIEAALARLDALAARSPRQERWLAQRGEILLGAGRATEALEAFRAARRACAALPARQRGTTQVAELERTVERRLAALETRQERM